MSGRSLVVNLRLWLGVGCQLACCVGVLARRTLAPPLEGLKGLQTGVLGDYVAWITVGTAILGGVWALTLR